MIDIALPLAWEFQRVFLETSLGIVPLIRVGAGFYGHGPLLPTWQLFFFCAGVSEREMVKAASKYLRMHDTLWRYNGVCQTGAEILDWVHSGMETLCTVEDLLAANPGVKITALRYKKKDGGSKGEKEYILKKIRTTKDLEKWVQSYKSLSVMEKTMVEFSFSENINLILPREDPRFPKDSKVVVPVTPPYSSESEAKYYYIGLDNGLPAFSEFPETATVFSAEEATKAAVYLEYLGVTVGEFESPKEKAGQFIVSLFKRWRWGNRIGTSPAYCLILTSFARSSVEFLTTTKLNRAAEFDDVVSAEKFINTLYSDHQKKHKSFAGARSVII